MNIDNNDVKLGCDVAKDKYDRKLQRELLKVLYDSSPDKLDALKYQYLVNLFGSESTLVANLVYLEGHALIVSGVKFGINDFIINLAQLEITSRGIDFIRDDGGLGAIINVQVVKFHDSTIVALEDIIRVANIPEAQKTGLISKLRELPADAIKHLTLQLLTPEVLQPQAVIQLIETLLRSS